jgi:hypothetical protein
MPLSHGDPEPSNAGWYLDRLCTQYTRNFHVHRKACRIVPVVPTHCSINHAAVTWSFVPANRRIIYCTALAILWSIIAGEKAELSVVPGSPRFHFQREVVECWSEKINVPVSHAMHNNYGHEFDNSWRSCFCEMKACYCQKKKKKWAKDSKEKGEETRDKWCKGKVLEQSWYGVGLAPRRLILRPCSTSVFRDFV